MQITHIRNGDISLETRIAGPEDGEPVILLHGFPECWNTWRHQIPQLTAAGYRVFVPNMRGYGHSSKPRAVADYHVKHLSADVDAIRQFTGAEKIHLVGHDWGAMVAWWYALGYQDHLASLSILNVPHPRVFMKKLKGSPAQLLKSWYIGFFQIPFLPELILPLGDFWFYRWILKKSSCPGSYSEEDYRILLEHWKIPGQTRATVNYYRSAGRSLPSPAKSKSRLQCPTQILWGENDLALSLEMAEQSAELLDNGTLTTYPDATHWLAHDKPEEISKRLVEHFVSNTIKG
ncbi:MAG: alpha/beta hydrolase [Oceanospirillaceae bacterium]|nr:alpha/beta hydrolase [Oceanospirillaceae bacterium]MAR01770.1 alpha/beta hydrolase [Oceanospirillaceae bacterium]|tara:strand:- start:4554 stop:5423 length:870 start_codon:yes stop_codon:yes gene_type:complete